MKAFLYRMLSRSGAQSLITPREIIRTYLSALGTLSADKSKKMSDIISTSETVAPSRDPDELDPDSIEI